MENHPSTGTISTHRVEAFSDAVFAIILTLLVLDLKVPDIQNLTTANALSVLAGLLPSFLSFAFSFLVIAIYWVNHHQFFNTLKEVDGSLLWFNNLLLFWLCFIPFPTSFLGKYPGNLVAVMLYGTILCFAAISITLMVHHAYLRANLHKEDMSMQRRRELVWRSSWGIFTYGLSVILAPVSIYISYAIFLIVPIIYFVPIKVGAKNN